MKPDYRSPNFVAPAARETIVAIEPARDLPPAPIMTPMPYSNHRDRAEGFTLATAPLAASVGLVAALVAVVGWSVPALSLVVLLIALGGFCVTWLLAYVANTLISPDGALFAHVILMWKYLRAEQKERNERLRRMLDDDK